MEHCTGRFFVSPVEGYYCALRREQVTALVCSICLKPKGRNPVGSLEFKVFYRPFSEVELGLAEELRKSPSMIRFYGERMRLELRLERTLTKQETKRLWGKVISSHPKNRG